MSVVFMFTYPLEPSQVSLISMFTIGIPAFFLALEPNKNIIKGHFLTNVFLKALPAAITDAVAVGALVIFGKTFGVGETDISTAATMLLAIVGFMILYKISAPMNMLRTAILTGCIAGLLFCSIFLNDLFAITGMTTKCIMLFIVFAIATEPVLRYLTILTEKIRRGLENLNFIDVAFEMEFRRLEQYTASGFDEAEFMISTNPGMPVRPLGMVASGGELSRIMLAIKAVLADTDDIPTLIFDEIDTGISGRTAQKESEKLSYIARNHQVICITHLPQIAAMADTHFEIAKSAAAGSTTTTIHPLCGDEMVKELARLLGGAKITDAVYDNAREMKILADQSKLYKTVNN